MESRVDIPLNKYVYIYILYSAFLLRKRVIKSAEAPNNNIECLFGKKERREFEGDRHGVDKDFSFSFHFFFFFFFWVTNTHFPSFMLIYLLTLSSFLLYFLMRSPTCHPLHFICTRESPFSFFICVA